MLIWTGHPCSPETIAGAVWTTGLFRTCKGEALLSRHDNQVCRLATPIIKKGFRLVAGHRALADIFLLIFAAPLAVLPVLRFNSIGPDIVWADLLRPDKFFTDAIIFHRLIPCKKTHQSESFFILFNRDLVSPTTIFIYIFCYGENYYSNTANFNVIFALFCRFLSKNVNRKIKKQLFF